jgi:hypothetical protein
MRDSIGLSPSVRKVGQLTGHAPYVVFRDEMSWRKLKDCEWTETGGKYADEGLGLMQMATQMTSFNT